MLPVSRILSRTTVATFPWALTHPSLSAPPGAGVEAQF